MEQCDPGERRRGRGVRLAWALVPASLTAGCQAEHPQSMLHPAGEAASHIAWLWWVLFAVCTAVFVIVMALTLVAIRRPRTPDDAPPPLGNRFVAVSGIFIPTVILIGILIASVAGQVALRFPSTGPIGPTVRVIGHQYWWEVVYPDEGIVTANELYIPVGEAVRLELGSADVIHSFWVPNLHGKMDMLPERKNTFWIAADRPGVFRGVCAEYCGRQHAKMAFEVVALPPEEYREWAARHAEPARASDPEEHALGRAVFVRACAQCHAAADLPAAGGLAGPDLTFIASRRTLGAATIPNTPQNLEAWVVDPHRFKPGNKMPRTELPPDELRALLDYMATLK